MWRLFYGGGFSPHPSQCGGVRSLASPEVNALHFGSRRRCRHLSVSNHRGRGRCRWSTVRGVRWRLWQARRVSRMDATGWTADTAGKSAESSLWPPFCGRVCRPSRVPILATFLQESALARHGSQW